MNVALYDPEGCAIGTATSPKWPAPPGMWRMLNATTYPPGIVAVEVHHADKSSSVFTLPEET